MVSVFLPSAVSNWSILYSVLSTVSSRFHYLIKVPEVATSIFLFLNMHVAANCTFSSLDDASTSVLVVYPIIPRTSISGNAFSNSNSMLLLVAFRNSGIHVAGTVFNVNQYVVSRLLFKNSDVLIPKLFAQLPSRGPGLAFFIVRALYKIIICKSLEFWTGVVIHTLRVVIWVCTISFSNVCPKIWGAVIKTGGHVVKSIKPFYLLLKPLQTNI